VGWRKTGSNQSRGRIIIVYEKASCIGQKNGNKNNKLIARLQRVRVRYVKLLPSLYLFSFFGGRAPALCLLGREE